MEESVAIGVQFEELFLDINICWPKLIDISLGFAETEFAVGVGVDRREEVVFSREITPEFTAGRDVPTAHSRVSLTTAPIAITAQDIAFSNTAVNGRLCAVIAPVSCLRAVNAFYRDFTALGLRGSD